MMQSREFRLLRSSFDEKINRRRNLNTGFQMRRRPLSLIYNAIGSGKCAVTNEKHPVTAV